MPYQRELQPWQPYDVGERETGNFEEIGYELGYDGQVCLREHLVRMSPVMSVENLQMIRSGFT